VLGGNDQDQPVAPPTPETWPPPSVSNCPAHVRHLERYTR
jgi:hypothetical protein